MRRTTNSIIAFVAFVVGLIVLVRVVACLGHAPQRSGLFGNMLWYFGHDHTIIGLILLVVISSHVLIYGLTAGLLALRYALASCLWIIITIVDLTGMLLRAPFSGKARDELRTLDFLRRPLFGPGRAPTARMRALALRVASEQGLTLTPETLRSFNSTRSFLNEHARTKY